VNSIPEMVGEKLDFSTKDERLKLLSQVLQASEADTQEEDVKEELFDGISTRVTRRDADIGSFSGANAVTYAHNRYKRAAEERHPLFKRFRK